MSLSFTVSEILNGVLLKQGSHKIIENCTIGKLVDHNNYVISYWSATISISHSCTIFELFNV